MQSTPARNASWALRVLMSRIVMTICLDDW
jgi:hypothetical protein